MIFPFFFILLTSKYPGITLSICLVIGWFGVIVEDLGDLRRSENFCGKSLNFVIVNLSRKI